MEKQTKSGIGFTGLLQLAFIILKIVGIINWEWIWVLSPMWISILLSLALFFIASAIVYWRDYR